MKSFKITMACLLAPMLAVLAPSASAIDVDMELALLIDVSGSIDGTEYNTQMAGYEAAFQSAAVANAIDNGLIGSIAVRVIQWSSSDEQVESIGWTQVGNCGGCTSAFDFGTAIGGLARAFSGLTAPGSALNWAIANNSAATNVFNSSRWVIDVSGDGEENSGADTSDARDAALLAGVEDINGIVLQSASVATWYQNNVVGGSNFFNIGPVSFADFGSAMEDKLFREITNVPVPGTLALLALGLFGLHRRRAALRA